MSGSSMSSGNEAAVADTAAYSAAAPAAGAAEEDSVSYEESAMVTAEPNAKNATEKGSAAAEHMDALSAPVTLWSRRILKRFWRRWIFRGRPRQIPSAPRSFTAS